jgi:hypothetical protein
MIVAEGTEALVLELHPARLGQTYHGDYVPQDAVHVALTMNPSLLNLFMKKFTRERVVPIISASVL